MRRLLRRQQRGEGSQWEVNAGEALKYHYYGHTREWERINSRDKIGLEFVQIDVEGSVKAQRRSDG